MKIFTTHKEAMSYMIKQHKKTGKKYTLSAMYNPDKKPRWKYKVTLKK